MPPRKPPIRPSSSGRSHSLGGTTSSWKPRSVRDCVFRPSRSPPISCSGSNTYRPRCPTRTATLNEASCCGRSQAVHRTVCPCPAQSLVRWSMLHGVSSRPRWSRRAANDFQWGPLFRTVSRRFTGWSASARKSSVSSSPCKSSRLWAQDSCSSQKSSPASTSANTTAAISGSPAELQHRIAASAAAGLRLPRSCCRPGPHDGRAPPGPAP